MKSYLVGGAVRNTLLGIAVTERDWVVVGSTNEEMLKRGFKSVGKQFPVFLHPESNEEYALARTEQKIAPGYHGFQFNVAPNVTIEQDLKRRDLTINAIAQDDNGTLIDPWGGRADLEARVLRHISDAFSEDPVRVLRVARFAARFYTLGFKIAPETLALMKQMVEVGEVDHLVPERVWQEVEKSLTSDTPSVFWQVLFQIGALARIAPEINDFLTACAKPTQQADSQPIPALSDMDNVVSKPPEVLFAILVYRAWQQKLVLTSLGERWKLPNKYRWLIEAIERFSEAVEQSDRLSHEEILNLIEQADALRRPERFEMLLSVYTLCKPNEGIKRLHKALNRITILEFGTEIEQLPGPDAKQLVRKLRLSALKGL